MAILIKYLGVAMIKGLLISWLFEAVFDAVISYAEKMAQRTDTDIDDEAVRKFKENRSTFLAYAKGKI